MTSYHFHKKCNFCGSLKRKIIFNIGSQNLVSCNSCHLVYFDRQRDDFDNLYNESYYSSDKNSSTANYADYEIQGLTFKQNFSFAYEAISNVVQPRKTKLLEIGAGYGYFANYLPPGIKYEAVEVSEEAVRQLRKQNRVTHKGEILSLRLKQKYDIIVAFDVIEHQIFLKEFIDEVHRLLKPNGIFIITTPDYNSILNKVFGKRAPTIQPLYHNYYFTQNWLHSSLPKLNFRILSMRTIHLTYLSIAQILLLGSYAFPLLAKLNLITVASKLKLDKVVVPFYRFGGIVCVIQKS